MPLLNFIYQNKLIICLRESARYDVNHPYMYLSSGVNTRLEVTLHFSFGIILCCVHFCNCCTIFKVYIYHFGMTIVRDFVKIMSIPDEELFSETAIGCTVSSFFLNY